MKKKEKWVVQMTDLEIMQRAKMYIDALAQGIDPLTNQAVPQDSTLNNVRLARCFFYVSDVLGRVIANGGLIGEKPKLADFSIRAEELARVPISPEPIRLTQLTQAVSNTVGNPQMKKLSANLISNWLLEKGFLEKQTGADGKSARVPTQNGLRLGLSTQLRQSQYGAYQAVLYNPQAQQFVLDHLPDMLKAKEPPTADA